MPTVRIFSQAVVLRPGLYTVQPRLLIHTHDRPEPRMSAGKWVQKIPAEKEEEKENVK